ncbi:thioesterase family protein [Nocardioides sp. DS6]|uniref:Thioesterase family protein n=1 Tax=Nocardioides eburneus TaxID=3231482 RepID=A0ABV3SYY2_9ACTN
MSEFDRDIAVNKNGVDTYAAELAPGWVVGGGVNGGYLLAVVASALRQHLPTKPDPITMSATYASASTPGPAEVRIDVRRDGRSLATAIAELWQGDDLRLTVLATYGDLAALHAAGEPLEHVTAVPPDLPPREQCLAASLAPDRMRRTAPMLERFDMLFHPEQVGWAVGAPTEQGRISAWYRLADGREPDPLSLLQVIDALPPVTFDFGMPGWAPTLELTCHVRHRPAPGWLQVVHATRHLAGGMFEEDCEVWDSAGRLVAQGRQLARLPRVR